MRLTMPTSIAAAQLLPYRSVAQLEGGLLVRLELEDGGCLTTWLLMGTDSRGSRMWQWSQIQANGHDYKQRGLVATVATAWPNQTTHQRFLPTGPLALLPVRGSFSSIMVAYLQALPRHELASAITDALTSGQHNPPKTCLGELLGSILVPAHSTCFVEPPAVADVMDDASRSFTLSLQHTGRYVLPWVALVGVAAHGIHPLVGQGVNLGFSDIKVLATAIASALEAGQDIGSAAVLESQYEQLQKKASSAMAAAMDALKAISTPQEGPMAGLCSLGLALFKNAPLLKQTLLRIAMHGV